MKKHGKFVDSLHDFGFYAAFNNFSVILRRPVIVQEKSASPSWRYDAAKPASDDCTMGVVLLTGRIGVIIGDV